MHFVGVSITLASIVRVARQAQAEVMAFILLMCVGIGPWCWHSCCHRTAAMQRDSPGTQHEKTVSLKCTALFTDENTSSESGSLVHRQTSKRTTKTLFQSDAQTWSPKQHRFHVAIPSFWQLVRQRCEPGHTVCRTFAPTRRYERTEVSPPHINTAPPPAEIPTVVTWSAECFCVGWKFLPPDPSGRTKVNLWTRRTFPMRQ